MLNFKLYSKHKTLCMQVRMVMIRSDQKGKACSILEEINYLQTSLLSHSNYKERNVGTYHQELVCNARMWEQTTLLVTKKHSILGEQKNGSMDEALPAKQLRRKEAAAC